MDDSPAVRVRAARDTLGYLQEFERGLRDSVRAKMPAESVELLDKLPAMGWYVVEHDRHLVDALLDVLGEDKAAAYFRWFMGQMLDNPLLRASRTATVSLFGLSPASLLRATPLAWPAVFRGFGEPKVESTGKGVAVMAVNGIHPDVMAAGSYAFTFTHLFAGYADFCGNDGSCESGVDEEHRSMRFELHWSESEG
jgi:hypothetical protein